MANNKELTISLIKDNLKNTCLLLGLEKLGIHAEPYHLNLIDSIFQLIGFEKDDFEEEIFERYSILIDEIVSFELLEDSERLKKVCNDIYENLINERAYQKQKTERDNQN